VLVRREAEQAPLASTFVSVLEPYETKTNLAAIRRLELEDAKGRPCSDGEVGIEVQLADGRRDIFISKNVEGQPTTNSTLVVEKGGGVRFEGDLCLVRFDAAQQPTRVLFCRGKSLRVGKLLVQAKNEQASYELDLTGREPSVVTGPADSVTFSNRP
jgi:hypothetical protein